MITKNLKYQPIYINFGYILYVSLDGKFRTFRNVLVVMSSSCCLSFISLCCCKGFE